MSDFAGEQRIESWWRIKAGEPCHAKMVAYGQFLRQMLRPAHAKDRAGERMYENRAMRRYGAAVAALAVAGVQPAMLNVVKSVIDTFGARIGKRRAMPAFSVNDADWSLKRQAREYRKWLVGKMGETEFDRLSVKALLDCCRTRAGITAIYAGDDDVIAERVYANEVLVDPREGQYGKPWQMIRTRRVARDWLLDKYPEFKTQIQLAPTSTREPWEALDDDVSRLVDLTGYVDVYEAWRLPSCAYDDDGDEGSGDGRHAICLDTCTLRSAEWCRSRFPISVMRYDDCVRGWWGYPLIEGLAPIQQEINSIVRRVNQNLDVTGNVVILEQEQSASAIEMLTGSRPYRIKYKGLQPPQWHVPEPVSQGQIEMLKMYRSEAFALCGMSEAMASSRSSLGLNASGVALDTQYDIESERLSQQESRYANYRLDAAQCYLDAAQDIAHAKEKDKGKRRSSVLVANYTVGSRTERVDFAKVAMKDGEYRLQLEPVNFIPDTRAGKLSAVQELAKAGVIPQWMVGSLFDEPDLARANQVAFADFHNCERIMERVGDPDVDLGSLMPEPYHDLALYKAMARAYYNRAQAEIDERDPEREPVLERFHTVIDECIELMKRQQQDAAAAAGPPMGGAPGPGGPMPMGAPPGAGGPGLPPGMGPPNGMPVPPIIAPPRAA